ncbi:unnamed protein product [Durusdinium trenchii]|uniref:Pentatricopeptide repeat-containing protein n=2 Tax=Durusdinium trenchii TaxID=1381693 RepID=A0ABP0Q4J2_9DINO
MMSACERCTLWEQSMSTLGMLEEDPQVVCDVVTLTSAIGGVEWPWAVELLKLMPQRGVKANVVAFSSVISAIGEPEGRTPSGSSEPSGYEEEGGNEEDESSELWPAVDVWPMALQVLDLMGDDEVPPNDISCNSAIIVCGRGGQWQLALSLLWSMLRSRYAVDLYTGYSTVWACETAGEWELALEILKVIPETRAKPNVFGCASDVNLCYRQNRWQLGLYLINILSQVALLRI